MAECGKRYSLKTSWRLRQLVFHSEDVCAGVHGCALERREGGLDCVSNIPKELKKLYRIMCTQTNRNIHINK